MSPEGKPGYLVFRDSPKGKSLERRQIRNLRCNLIS